MAARSPSADWCGGFVCHYPEPQASDPRHSAATVALLIVPVVDIFHPQQPCAWTIRHVASAHILPADAAVWRRLWRMGPLPGRSWRSARGRGAFARASRRGRAGWAASRLGHHEDFPPVPLVDERSCPSSRFPLAAEAKGLFAATATKAISPGSAASTSDWPPTMAIIPGHGDYLDSGPQTVAGHDHGRWWLGMSLEKMKTRIQVTAGARAHLARHLHLTCPDARIAVVRPATLVLFDAAGRWPITTGKGRRGQTHLEDVGGLAGLARASVSRGSTGNPRPGRDP